MARTTAPKAREFGRRIQPLEHDAALGEGFATVLHSCIIVDWPKTQPATRERVSPKPKKQPRR